MKKIKEEGGKEWKRHNKESFVREYCLARKIPYRLVKEQLYELMELLLLITSIICVLCKVASIIII